MNTFNLNVQIIDQKLTLEARDIKTRNFLSETAPGILLQATILVDGMVAIADAIARDESGRLIIIECKATSTTKKAHLFDLYYQYEVFKKSRGYF